MEVVYDCLLRHGTLTSIEIRNLLRQRTIYKNKELVKDAKNNYETQKKLWTKRDMNNYIKQNEIKTISLRTIQRCLKLDRRIKKNKNNYSIDDDIRFETRYLDPHRFGQTLTSHVLGDIYSELLSPESDEIVQDARKLSNFYLKEYISRIGALVLFLFLEAAKPFNNNLIHKKDRKDLVYYWLENVFPMTEIFEHFRLNFTQKDTKEVYLEMNDEAISNTLELLEQTVPKIYKLLIQGKKNASFYFKYDNRILLSSGKSLS